MNSLLEKYNKAQDEYLSRLAMENLSPNTINNYSKVLRRFGDFLAENEQPDEFVAVVSWKKKLFEAGCKPSTIKEYLTTLQIFFKAVSHRSSPAEIRFPENPIDKDLMPKIPARPYEQVLTDEQVKMLYDNRKQRDFQFWARNWAMIQLCLNEKIRNAELLDLKLSDVDMIHHILVVQSGKGRKYREVDMCELTELAISLYLDSGLRPSFLSDNDYLFGTTSSHEFGNSDKRVHAEKWHRGTGRWLSEVIERTVFAVTGVHDVRSHDLRHVGSRVCLNAGQSMEELQGQLGHSQITTTQIYTSRMGSRRNRESAKSVLAAREEAAKRLRKENRTQEKVVRLYA